MNWTSVAASADGTKLAAVFRDDYDSNTGGIFSSGEIWTSSDSGATWSHVGQGDFNSVASSADGTKLVAVTGLSSVYLSSDSGVTWRIRDVWHIWSSVASSADGTRLIAGERLDMITDHDFLYTSADSGVTWTPVGPQQSWTSVASSTDGTKLVAAGAIIENDNMVREISENGTKLVAIAGRYIYTDSGATWSNSGQQPLPNTVALSADGTKLVGAAYCDPDHCGRVPTGGYIYTSMDFGTTWTQTGPQENWTTVASSADGTKLVAAASNWGYSSGHIYTYP